MAPESQVLVGGAVQALIGLAVSTGFLLALYCGFLVVVGFTKFRKTGKGSLVVRNLADRMDDSQMRYFAPDTHRGPADQLRTPELLEQAGESAEAGSPPADAAPAS